MQYLHKNLIPCGVHFFGLINQNGWCDVRCILITKYAFEIVVLLKTHLLGFKVKEVNVLAARKLGREQKFKGRGRMREKWKVLPLSPKND